MKINANSWHYKIVNWTYMYGLNNAVCPDLCTYMRRLLLVAPILGVVFVVMQSIMLPITLLKLIVGERPSGVFWQSDEEYGGLMIGNFELYPWHIVLPGIIIYAHYFAVKHIGWKFLGYEGLGIFGIALLIFVLILILDTQSPFRVWVKAKTQRFCPLVEFETKENNDNA